MTRDDRGDALRETCMHWECGEEHLVHLEASRREDEKAFQAGWAPGEGAFGLDEEESMWEGEEGGRGGGGSAKWWPRQDITDEKKGRLD